MCADDADSVDEPGSKCRRIGCNEKYERLPVPCSIVQMFTENEEALIDCVKDNPHEHGGRLRSFPHLAGNWASYVYIPVLHSDRWNSFALELSSLLHPFKFELMNDHHVSLSRTVTLKYHWIDPLSQKLRSMLGNYESSICDYGGIKIYANDELTRTFVSVQVNSEETNLHDYVQVIDRCFEEYGLPAFYQDQSFHVSLLSCVGNVASQISQDLSAELQALTRQFLADNVDLSVMDVSQLHFKTGNMKFVFMLMESNDL